MRPEKHNSRPEISPPESTTQLPSAPRHANVDAIERMERGSELGWRAHLALPRVAFKWLHRWCACWPDQRDLHRMVNSDSLLGNAIAQGRRTHSSYGMDPSRDGSFAVRCRVRSGINRARGLVSGDNA